VARRWLSELPPHSESEGDMIATEGRERGEARAKRGIKRAAYCRDWDIARDELRLLETMLRNPDVSVTTDDIVDDLAKKFRDGGNWRANIEKRPQAAGIIATDGVTKSARPSRHGGYTTRWKIADTSAAESRRDELREFFLSHPTRPADEKQTGESAGTDSPANPTDTNPPNGETNNGAAR
jgi:hypothetical protein